MRVPRAIAALVLLLHGAGGVSHAYDSYVQSVVAEIEADPEPTEVLEAMQSFTDDLKEDTLAQSRSALLENFGVETVGENSSQVANKTHLHSSLVADEIDYTGALHQSVSADSFSTGSDHVMVSEILADGSTESRAGSFDETQSEETELSVVRKQIMTKRSRGPAESVGNMAQDVAGWFSQAVQKIKLLPSDVLALVFAAILLFLSLIVIAVMMCQANRMHQDEVSSLQAWPKKAMTSFLAQSQRESERRKNGDDVFLAEVYSKATVTQQSVAEQREHFAALQQQVQKATKEERHTGASALTSTRPNVPLHHLNTSEMTE